MGLERSERFRRPSSTCVDVWKFTDLLDAPQCTLMSRSRAFSLHPPGGVDCPWDGIEA